MSKELFKLYAEADAEREILSNKLAKAVEALKRVLKSEALKEAPFYSYCESILNAKAVLKEIRVEKS